MRSAARGGRCRGRSLSGSHDLLQAARPGWREAGHVDDAVGDRVTDVLVVEDAQDGDAAPLLLADQLDARRPVGGVERGGRFVEQQQGRGGAKPRAMLTRCCSPPEKVAGGRLQSRRGRSRRASTLGSQPAPAGYFRRIRGICDTHGVLYIADEVMCGMRRARVALCPRAGGRRRRHHHDGQGSWRGLRADRGRHGLGKGGGRDPVRQRHVLNGHTYMSHAVACAGRWR